MILELGPGADILRALGALHWVICFSLIALVLWLVKKWLVKIPLALILIYLFVAPVFQAKERVDERKEAYVAVRRPAEALFNEKCKVANEQYAKAITPIENVESILLLKVRPKSTGIDWKDQYWPGAALGPEASEGMYILNFLWDRDWDASNDNKKPQWRIKREIGGNGIRMFRYVEVFDPENGKSERVTARRTKAEQDGVNVLVGFELVREPISKPSSRFAVTFEDDVDPENRKHWLAGTTIKVLDTKTNEVIGEQQYWALDTGFGSTNQRSPWQTFPMTCPKTKTVDTGWETHHFVEKILKAKQGK